MKRMWWALLAVGSCLQARQRSAAFLARELSGITPVSVAVAGSEAGGPCYGPSCCVHVSRRASDGRCALVAACEEDDAAMLKHLEIAVVCQEAEESYTHHSFGYGAVKPVANVTTRIQCGVACLAPAKSNFAFTRTFRHLKLRRGAENQSTSSQASEPDQASSNDDAEQPPVAAVAEYLPSQCPTFQGRFAVGASPCCKRSAALLEVLKKDVCSADADAPPDVCSASCFLALQLVLGSSTEGSDDDAFCGAYLPVERSFSSLLNAVCTRSDGQTCASELSESAVTAWPSVLAGWGSDAPAAAPAATANATANATATAAANATLLQGKRPARPAATPARAPAQLRSQVRPGFAALFMRSLLASDQGTAVARVAAAVVGLARESRRNETADADAALKAVCTPCYDKAVGAGLAVLNAVAEAAPVFSPKLAEEVANSIWSVLPLPLGWKEKVNGTDLISVRDVATAIFTGVCARDEEGGFCLPKQKANADSAASTRGAEQCSTRCGKVGAQIALWNGAHADRINGKPTELAKAVALIDSGCAMRDESYCIDEFWAFVGQEKDIAKTVENWTSNCATASSGGACGDCADVLKDLDHFGCCKGPILEGTLLLAARHTALEEWGFVEEGKAARLDAAAVQAAIRDGVEKWTAACDRPSWAEVCKTCTKQVALAVDMPDGVTQTELRQHQFRIEEALLDDVALNVREPRGNLKVLDFATRGETSENVSVVVGVRGENCPLAASAAKAFRKRLDDGDVVFAHLPEAIGAIADPVKEVVSFDLLYKNGTDFSNADSVVALRQKVAANMAIAVADVEIPPPAQAGADGTRVHGTARADRDAARKLAENLADGQPLKTPDLVKSDVEVSILPNEPAVRAENRTVNEAFGPDRCVHITQADSGECVLTTRNCDLEKLKHFEMAFVCKTPSGKHEKHSYGRGGGLGQVGFKVSESFNTEISCVKCIVPDETQLETSPAPKHATGAGAAMAALLLFLSLD